MFFGQHRHSLDPKGRVIFPAKYREDLGESFFLSVGTDECISVYPETEWAKLVAKIDEMPITKTTQVKRFLFPRSERVNMDKQGRVLIPENIRNLAGIEIDKDIVIAGLSSKIEIWDEAKYDAMMAADSMSAEEIAAQMELLGI